MQRVDYYHDNVPYKLVTGPLMTLYIHSYQGTRASVIGYLGHDYVTLYMYTGVSHDIHMHVGDSIRPSLKRCGKTKTP